MSNRSLEERMSGDHVDSSKYILDLRGYFDSIKDIDGYRKRNFKANGEVYTCDGYLVDEDLRRVLENLVLDIKSFSDKKQILQIIREQEAEMVRIIKDDEDLEKTVNRHS